MNKTMKSGGTTAVGVGISAALVLAGIASGSTPAFAVGEPTERTVHADQIGAETAASYPVNQWFVGYSSNTSRSAVVTNKQLVLTDDTQVLSKYFGDSDLVSLVDGGLEVTSTAGQAFLQIPIVLDGGPGFTTLRPADAAPGTTTVDADDDWVSSKPIGGVSTGTLAELEAAISDIDADYDIVGVGVFAEGDTAVTSLQFDDVKYDFTAALAAAGAASDTAKVQLVNVGEETEAGYPEENWFEGLSSYPNTGLSVTGTDLEFAPNTQLLSQFSDDDRPADLESFINAGIAYTVAPSSTGLAFFQIPVGYGDGKFTTLRPSVATTGLNTVSYGQLWEHSGTIAGVGDVATLAEIVSAIDAAGGEQTVYGYGIFSEGTSLVSSIQWNGLKTSFADDPALKFDSLSIVGGTKVGTTVSAELELNYPGATYSYQWLRDGKSIEGADAETFRLSTTDFEKKISVRVKATKTGFASVTGTSAAVTATAGTFVYPVEPKISGTVKVNSTIKAVVTTSPGAEFSYRWQRNGSNISKATGSSFKLTGSDAGKTITVRVTAERKAYATKTIEIGTPNRVAYGTLALGKPTLSGTAKVGKSIKAKSHGASSGTSLRYIFTADGVIVKNSSSSKLTLKKSMKGEVIRVTVVASKTGYTVKTSAASTGKTVK